MPYGVGAAGGPVMVNPGYDASASSTAAAVKDRPTGSAEGSRTVQRSSTDAASSVRPSSAGGVISDQATTDGAPSPSAVVSCSRTQLAFASTSSPVSTNSTVLRNPPSSLTHTLSCAGGAEPRTPEIATRSGPACATSIESRWVVTSGPR